MLFLGNTWVKKGIGFIFASLICMNGAFAWITERPVHQTVSASSVMASLEQRVVAFVHGTVATIQYTAYKLGGQRFDPQKGVYVVDCSSFVDHVLRAVCPQAYSSLVNSSGTYNPTTKDYYHFFNQLSPEPHHYWSKVGAVKELQPGDILVFRSQPTYRLAHYSRKRHHRKVSAEGAGHVMIVMSKPIFDTDSFEVQVADSASAGHSDDTRMPHESGIGIGTLLLKVNLKTGQPYAYAWKMDSYFKNVKFAMARPVDMTALTEQVGDDQTYTD